VLPFAQNHVSHVKEEVILPIFKGVLLEGLRDALHDDRGLCFDVIVEQLRRMADSSKLSQSCESDSSWGL
jgi:hypothetical protein